VDADTHQPRQLISVTEIRRRLGSRAPVNTAIEAAGLALSDSEVPDGAPVVITGEVESISDGVVLTGVVGVDWRGQCRRCLGPVTGRAEVEVREIWELNPTEGETWPLDHDHIDVGPLLHDTALLALPLAPLCGPDCAGPAPESYPATVAKPDDDAPPRDPRWAALDDLEL